MPPESHRCDVPDLDYASVKEGFIICEVCGRIYRFVDGGWVANPPARDSRATKQRRWQRR